LYETKGLQFPLKPKENAKRPFLEVAQMHKSKSKGSRVGGGRLKNQLYKKPFKWLYKIPRCAPCKPPKEGFLTLLCIQV
jgi:hypothetical protein